MVEKNAARLLYERLRDWIVTPGGLAVLDFRASDGDWWTRHAEAVGWLREVEQQLELMRALDPEGEVPFAGDTIDRLRKAVFVPEHKMTEHDPTGRVHVTQADLAALHMLAMAWRVDAPANPAAAVDLLEVTRDIQDLLMNADDLDPGSKDYMLGLVHALEQAITAVAVHGTADVQRLADQLVGALLRFLADAPEEKVGDTRGVIQRLISGFRVFVGLVPPTVKAIESTQSLFGGPAALPPGG